MGLVAHQHKNAISCRKHYKRTCLLCIKSEMNAQYVYNKCSIIKDNYRNITKQSMIFCKSSFLNLSSVM